MSSLVFVFMLVVGFVWLAQFSNWSNAMKKKLEKKVLDHPDMHYEKDWIRKPHSYYLPSTEKSFRKRVRKEFPDEYYGSEILFAIGLIGCGFIMFIGLIAAETF